MCDCWGCHLAITCCALAIVDLSQKNCYWPSLLKQLSVLRVLVLFFFGVLLLRNHGLLTKASCLTVIRNTCGALVQPVNNTWSQAGIGSHRQHGSLIITLAHLLLCNITRHCWKGLQRFFHNKQSLKRPCVSTTGAQVCRSTSVAQQEHTCGTTGARVWHNRSTHVAQQEHTCGTTGAQVWHNRSTCVAQQEHTCGTSVQLRQS